MHRTSTLIFMFLPDQSIFSTTSEIVPQFRSFFVQVSKNMSTFFRGLVTRFNKEMHVRPVIWVSVAMGTVGLGVTLRRALAETEYNMESYLDQNEINIRTIHERELNSEFFLLLNTPPERIPVAKRHIWQMAGEAEKVAKEINKLPTPDQRTPEQSEQFEGLYKRWMSQIYDVYWTMAEQRAIYTHAERAEKQARQYAVLHLPPAIPFTIRPFPETESAVFDTSIIAPVEDADRQEFVNYYARRYNVDL